MAQPLASRRGLVVGRVPIFDTELRVHGYEFATVELDQEAPLEVPGMVLPPAILDGPRVDHLVGASSIWVKAPVEVVSGEVPCKLPPSRTVLLVPYGGRPLESLLEGCRSLRRCGYNLAFFAEPDGAPQDMLELGSFLMIDSGIGPNRRAEIVELAHRLDLIPVAMGTNTLGQMKEWEEAGVSHFHGHLLSRLVTSERNPVTPGRAACLQLLSRLRDADSSAADFETIISRDVGLSYRLLHISGLGSSGGLRRPVRSLREAVVLLGRDRLYSWLTLILIGDLQPLSREQANICMTRARMCELMAHGIEPVLADSAFTAGLVSGLALVIGVEPSEIVRRLAIADELRLAVADGAGTLGSVLDDVLQWEVAEATPKLTSGVDLDVAENHYLEAIGWTSQIALSVEGAV